MTARILVVDDEPDLETLIQQKFRHQIRDGAISFLFARDGVEALATLAANQDVDLVVDRHQHAADGRAHAPPEAAGERGKAVDHHRLGLWRHDQHPHRDEPRRVRFPDQADRFSRPRNDDCQDYPAYRESCGMRSDGRRRPSGPTPRCRVTSRPIWRRSLPAMRTRWI